VTAIQPDPPDISSIFELQHHGPDVWVGLSPAYHWGRIYGGLVIAQALWAATQSVAENHVVHSLHAYFILGGDPAEPVRYEVDRIRNGRSFTTRRVVARQSSGAILNLSCSFQVHEDGIESQTADFPTDAPLPSALEVSVEGTGIERADVATPGEPISLAWCRFRTDLGDDPRLHPCALAYISDTSPMNAVVASHPNHPVDDSTLYHERYMLASLDHAMWFHRPVRADDWVLLDMRGQGIIRTRGLGTGRIFTADGAHVASVAQEGLIRELG
jgi:acyl-CoA thioesterase-2